MVGDKNCYNKRYVFTFGRAKKCSDSDTEWKYFPTGMNAREPLWC